MDRFSVVLCRAEGAANVGAVCRAMKCMGLKRLVLADCPDFAADTVRTHALHAYDVYERAERHGSLEAALRDVNLAIGFTRRLGRWRKQAQDIRQFALSAMEASACSMALVFGNERNGLSGVELDICDSAVFIPTDSAFPSLNLSHAVQIVCWQLRALLPDHPDNASVEADSQVTVPASTDPGYCAEQVKRAVIHATVEGICDCLSARGFFKIAGREDAAMLLNAILARAGVSGTELKRFKALFHKLAAMPAAFDPESTRSGSMVEIDTAVDLDLDPGSKPH